MTSKIKTLKKTDHVRDILAFRFHLIGNIWSGTSHLFYKRMFGLGLLEWRVIWTLGALDTLSLKGLGRAADIDKTRASRTVTRLVSSGLIRKEGDAEDGRAIKVTLTKKGQKIYSAALEEARKRNDEWLSVLKPEDRKKLYHWLDQLTDKARELADRERRNTLAE